MVLRGKTALVTGASKGIGAAAAIALAKEGCSVAINFRSDEQAAQEVLAACDAHSSGNLLVQADVSSETEVANMIQSVAQKFPKLDILVNNAGIIDERDGPTSVEAFEHTFRNNLLGCVLLVKHALPLLKKSGKIVNISSIHARLGHGRPGAAAYSALKAALENYTENLAKELAPGILVNALAPGRVNTPMWGADEEEQKELGKAHLIERMIEPEEIADGIVFLAKNDAVCGEVLTIDGGMGLVTTS